MKLGIKVGFQKESFLDLEQTNAPFAEVWFNIARDNEYEELFAVMKRRQMDVGLHFWGTLDGDIEVNISYPDPKILDQSRRLILQCIDIAALHNYQYVNIHPGSRILTKIDFTKEQFIATEHSKDQKACEEALRESLTQLTTAAHNRGILLCTESIPPSAPGTPWSDPTSRSRPVHNDQMPLAVLAQIIPTIPHLGFANDFCHTAAQVISNSRTQVYEFLVQKTNALAPYTKLIHIGYIIAPYIGTDYHGNMYDPISKTTDAVPTTDELAQLLSLFVHRDDVFALVEPQKDHVGNYRFVKNLVDSITL